MDNAAQTDLHIASVVLKTRSFNFTILICLLHSAFYLSDLPENKRRSRADARIVPRDCGPTNYGRVYDGLTLRYTDLEQSCMLHMITCSELLYT